MRKGETDEKGGDIRGKGRQWMKGETSEEKGDSRKVEKAEMWRRQ